MGKKEKGSNPNRLPAGKFFAWKSRDVALGCNVIVLGYLTIFCTDGLGLPATLVGTLLLFSKIFDGVTELFAGYIVDNTRTRFGKGRPYELSILGVWLMTIIMFFCPPSMSTAVKAVWVFITYTFINSIFTTLLNACQTPYMIRAFGSRKVIVKVSSFGGIVSTLGSAVVSISFPRAMAALATSDTGWRNLILIYALPLMLIGILRFLFVKEEYDVDAAVKQEHIKMKEILLMLKTNKYAWLFAGITLCFNIVLGMNAAAYYFTYIVGDIGRFGTLQMLTIPMLLIMFIFPKLMNRIPVSGLIGMGAAFGIAGYILNFFAGSSMTMLMIAFVATSFAALPISYLQALIIMNLANFNEWKGMPRLEGTSGTVAGFASKIGSGIGSGILGILLGAAGFVSTATGESVTQPAAAMTMIRCLYSIVPAVLFTIMLLFTILYSKLDKLMPDIDQTLQSRRAAAKKTD